MRGVGRRNAGPRAPETFRGSAVPKNYVPGAGRGAIAFVTASDIGPIVKRVASNKFGAGGYRAGAGRGLKAVDDEGPPGLGTSIFEDMPYERDDAEADKIYASVDDAMAARTRTKRKRSVRIHPSLVVCLHAQMTQVNAALL